MIWQFILLTLVHVTIVCSGALLVAIVLRRAAYRHAVLLAGLVSLLIWPAFYAGSAINGISLRLPLMPPVQRAFTQTTNPGNVQLLASRPLPDMVTAPQTQSRESTVEANTERDTTIAAVEPSATTIPQPWQWDILLCAAWILGTIWLAYGIARSHRKLGILFQSVRRWNENEHRDVLSTASEQLGVSRFPPVGSSTTLSGPAVAGVLNPWILIPGRTVEILTASELVQILVHEGAHAIRRDTLVLLLQRIATSLYWWHPLLHIFNRHLCRAREEVCDDFVLRHAEPEAYSETLLRLAMMSQPTPTIPAMLGMFGSTWRLEHRIQGLLDPRRKIATRISTALLSCVFGGFVLLSAVVAAARLEPRIDNGVPESPQQEQEAKSVKEADEKIDVSNFRMVLTYHGDSDKPYYGLVLSVPPVSIRENPFVLFSRLQEKQAEPIVRALIASGFFQHARVTDNQNDPTTGPQYLLRVRLGDRHYEESLGWNIGTLIRLTALRQAMEGEPSSHMDRLLERLSGHRKVWEAGQTVDDLRTKLSMDERKLVSGSPIPIKLMLENEGKTDRTFGQHRFILSSSEFQVFDETGRDVPYLLGGAGLQSVPTPIAPGQTRVLEECDLSDYYYLRRRGRYTVAFRGIDLPLSNSVSFEVTTSATESDGDPIARLLSLNSDKWSLKGSPNPRDKMQPGSNRQEARGWQFHLVDAVKGMKLSKSVVWVWLTSEAAAEIKPRNGDGLPKSEYLGKIGRWHVYFYASPEAMAEWPMVKDEIKEALTREPMAPKGKLVIQQMNDAELRPGLIDVRPVVSNVVEKNSVAVTVSMPANVLNSDRQPVFNVRFANTGTDYINFYDAHACWEWGFNFQALDATKSSLYLKMDVIPLQHHIEHLQAKPQEHIDVKVDLNNPPYTFRYYGQDASGKELVPVRFLEPGRYRVEMNIVMKNPFPDNTHLWTGPLTTAPVEFTIIDRTEMLPPSQADIEKYDRALEPTISLTREAGGLWQNGISPRITLAVDAAPEDVIRAVVNINPGNLGTKDYRVLRIKRLNEDNGKRFVALISAGQSTKAILCFPTDKQIWWSRIYDASIGP